MSRRMRSPARLLLTLALLAAVLLALRHAGLLRPETGRFAAIDGDSLRRDGLEFRLQGIDAPELHQDCARGDGTRYACGLSAKAHLAGLVESRDLSCATLETDRYGRAVALCRAGNLDVNAEMVRLGWAVAYRGPSYVREERAAREARRGVWQGAFEPPEAWRERHRDALVRGSLAGEDASILD